jgi:hypothetical protein
LQPERLLLAKGVFHALHVHRHLQPADGCPEPFVEAKEVIGGYAIFELRDKAEAVAMAKEFMQLHLDHMPGWEGTCELRAFATPGVEIACQVDAQSRVAAHA